MFYCCWFACVTVCLLPRLHKKFLANFDETSQVCITLQVIVDLELVIPFVNSLMTSSTVNVLAFLIVSQQTVFVYS